MKIRPARSPDLSALTELYNYYVRHSDATFELESVSVQDREDWFSGFGNEGPYRLLVAEEQTSICGYATSSAFHPKPIYASSIEVGVYVAPSHLRSGIATALYSQLFDLVSHNPEIERFVAGVKLPNVASIALHKKLGFQEVGTFQNVGKRAKRFFDLCWLDRPARPAI